MFNQKAYEQKQYQQNLYDQQQEDHFNPQRRFSHAPPNFYQDYVIAPPPP